MTSFSLGSLCFGLLKTVDWGDLNHLPLGYEPNRVEDSNAFQRLDAAGNDTKSLERQESGVMGP